MLFQSPVQPLSLQLLSESSVGFLKKNMARTEQKKEFLQPLIKQEELLKNSVMIWVMKPLLSRMM